MVDLVFPPVCAGCGRVDYRFCLYCTTALGNSPIELIWPRVEALNVVCATGLHADVLADAIRAFKYEGARELAAPLAARLVKSVVNLDRPIDAIVPVPLSSERLSERGYNQSELLAQILRDETQIPCISGWLQRIRHTGQQVGLDESARRDNVQGAFDASAEVQGQSILLIDDVVTTGSTLGECALALKAKGAVAVHALAISHA